MSGRDFAPRFHLRSEQSGGEVSIMEMAVPGRWTGPPLHRHDFDEAFYVIEGQLTFQLGGELREAGPGELVFAARGADHTLANRSRRPARYLLICTPAGFERGLARRVAARAGDEPPEWALGPSPEVEMVGPPIELGPEESAGP